MTTCVYFMLPFLYLVNFIISLPLLKISNSFHVHIGRMCMLVHWIPMCCCCSIDVHCTGQNVQSKRLFVFVNVLFLQILCAQRKMEKNKIIINASNTKYLVAISLWAGCRTMPAELTLFKIFVGSDFAPEVGAAIFKFKYKIMLWMWIVDAINYVAIPCHCLSYLLLSHAPTLYVNLSIFHFYQLQCMLHVNYRRCCLCWLMDWWWWWPWAWNIFRVSFELVHLFRTWQMISLNRSTHVRIA